MSILYRKCGQLFSQSVLYLYIPHKTFLRRVLWVLCEILAIYGSYNVMRDSWIRYNTNPTVITVQKDYRFWYLQFPSTTFCYVDPVDIEFAKDYVQRWVEIILYYKNLMFVKFFNIVLSSKWKVSSGKQFDYYMDFVKKVANITYENIDSIAPFVNNTELINVDIIDLVLKVLLKFVIFIRFLKCISQCNNTTY